MFVKVAGDLVSNYIKQHLDLKSSSTADSDVTLLVAAHLREALGWSRRMQFYGMSTASETDMSTIPLRLKVEPRRFRSTSSAIERYEAELLADERNYLLLGDPGAGKTTTIKRLVQRLFVEEPFSETDQYTFPIVLRLRELSRRETILTATATALGIPVQRRRAEQTSVDKRETLWVGPRRLLDVLAEFLNQNKVVLFSGRTR